MSAPSSLYFISLHSLSSVFSSFCHLLHLGKILISSPSLPTPPSLLFCLFLFLLPPNSPYIPPMSFLSLSFSFCLLLCVLLLFPSSSFTLPYLYSPPFQSLLLHWFLFFLVSYLFFIIHFLFLSTSFSSIVFFFFFPFNSPSSFYCFLKYGYCISSKRWHMNFKQNLILLFKPTFFITLWIFFL